MLPVPIRTLLASRRAVAVFGSSEPLPGEPLYEAARQASARLAAAGLVILNGGYGGVMEAASRGAREAGGTAIGITVEAFTHRLGGNAWLSLEAREPDLHLRTRTLIMAASGFLVLEGKAGTLAEATLLFALRRARLLGSRPVVLAGDCWTGAIPALRQAGVLEEDALGETWIEREPVAGAALLVRLLGAEAPAR